MFVIENGEWNLKEVSLLDFLSKGNCPLEWSSFFQRENTQKALLKISETLKERIKEVHIYPPLNRIFRTFELPKEKIKVVVLGMDPYYNPGSATGLCFSVPKNVHINSSLKNIYRELKNEGFDIKETGDLSHWLDQGCFMLNTALTVEKDTPGSHIALWKPFTTELLVEIDKDDKIVWVLMGVKALGYKKYINSEFVIITSHPSPLSAFKGFKTFPAFINSGIFKEVNSLLKRNCRTPIQW